MKLVYSYYVLDIIHRGHILMMKNAKTLAGKDGKSIVGILTDRAVMEKKSKPVISFNERIQVAQAIKYVDMVVSQKTYSPISNIKIIQPDILLESDSHSKKDIEEVRKVVKKWGGKVVVMPYFSSQSSTDIKQKIKREGKK